MASPTAAALLAALALAAGGGRTATPRPATGPDAPVREAYRLEDACLREDGEGRQELRLPLEEPHRARLFSRGLAALVERDARYSEVTGEVGNLDYDPFLSGQDAQVGVFADLAVDVVKTSKDRAEVRARFVNFEPRDVRFDLVREGGRWVIDDVRDGAVSLRAELEKPYGCAEGWTEPCADDADDEPGPDLEPKLDPAAAPSGR